MKTKDKTTKLILEEELFVGGRVDICALVKKADINEATDEDERKDCDDKREPPRILDHSWVALNHFELYPNRLRSRRWERDIGLDGQVVPMSDGQSSKDGDSGNQFGLIGSHVRKGRIGIWGLSKGENTTRASSALQIGHWFRARREPAARIGEDGAQGIELSALLIRKDGWFVAQRTREVLSLTSCLTANVDEGQNAVASRGKCEGFAAVDQRGREEGEGRGGLRLIVEEARHKHIDHLANTFGS